MGVSIYEGSRVGSVDGKTLTVDDGRVTAAKTFICTEGYSGHLLGSRTLIPINSSMIVTKPLSEEAWQQIGWNGPQCLSDSAHTFIYAQRTVGRPHRHRRAGECPTATAPARETPAQLPSPPLT